MTEHLDHTPTREPDGRHGMMVFGARWLRLMEAFRETLDSFEPDPPEIECVLNDYPFEITQRAAHVAANFIAWLGTNVGRSYLSEAERLTKWMPAPSAYAAQWALANHRFLARDEGNRISGLFTPDDPNQRDLEVIEHVAWWLGGTDGQTFLQECQQFSRWDHHKEISNAFASYGYAGVNWTIDLLIQCQGQQAE